MTAFSSYLDRLVTKIILDDGTPVPRRNTMNFIGVTIVDDPTNGRTNCTFTGGAGPTDHNTLSNLTVGNVHTQYALRSGSTLSGTYTWTGGSVVVDAGTVTATNIRRAAGDPNTVVSGALGDWYVNTTNGDWYYNDDGATSWALVVDQTPLELTATAPLPAGGAASVGVATTAMVGDAKLDIGAKGSNVASAGTINLDTATGDYVHITGTTTITAITLASGLRREVTFDGILTLTNSGNLILPTGANIITAAGDVAVFRGEGSSIVRCTSYTRADGNSLAAPSETSPAIVITSTGTIASLGTGVTGVETARIFHLNGAAPGIHGIRKPGPGEPRQIVIQHSDSAATAITFVHLSGTAAAAEQLFLAENATTELTLYGDGDSHPAVLATYDDTFEWWHITAITRNTYNRAISSSSTGALNSFNPTNWQRSRFIYSNGAAPVYNGLAQLFRGRPKKKTFFVAGNTVATFTYNSGSAAAGEKIIIPGFSTRVVVGPATVELEYSDSESVWHLTNVFERVYPIRLSWKASSTPYSFGWNIGSEAPYLQDGYYLAEVRMMSDDDAGSYIMAGIALLKIRVVGGVATAVSPSSFSSADDSPVQYNTSYYGTKVNAAGGGVDGTVSLSTGVVTVVVTIGGTDPTMYARLVLTEWLPEALL